ncbi:hypothetical protein ILUMI_08773 [Ignelater luminosus]|uniref:Transposase n=1 Tax=Ignelater luminosus TaxID=2038154 RepID=A0A8K0GD33_IGNLU|nr:hypothetical protein ILUMI_08773 [Ignelater luminosus]
MNYQGSWLLFLGQADTENRRGTAGTRPTAFQLPLIKCGGEQDFIKSVDVSGCYLLDPFSVCHLKRRHGQECVEEYKAYMKKKKEDKTNEQNCSKILKKDSKKYKEIKTLTQEEFEENIVEYFIHSMIPLRSVEDSYFLKIFTNLEISNVGLKLISRRSLGRRIDSYYEKKISQISTELQEVDFVCTTVDIWSGKKRSFLGTTANWITKDLKRTSVALACQRFKSTHSYDCITDLIQKINTVFGFTANKLVASVTDNGSNSMKAFRTFGVQLTNIICETLETVEFAPEDALVEEIEIETISSWDKEEEFCLLPAHLRCCAHTLSLCAAIDPIKFCVSKILRYLIYIPQL